ncbi:alpha/beta hydrolase [Candidatus Woesearchaeota archaeon]|nr:alpha/beta hydrolase [Candidatus Woesearchaeota archaeon]
MVKKRLRSFDGTKIFYTYKKGKHPLTLVFLHGVGGNWTIWKQEMQYLHQKEYSTLGIDLRGHGLSDAPLEFEKYHLSYFAQDVHQIIHHEKITQFVLIGHSLGGCIAINYCMHHPKHLPASLVLVESTTIYPFDHNRLLNLGPHTTHLLRFIAEHKAMQRSHLFHLEEVDLSHAGITENLHLISHLIHLTPLRTIVKALDNMERYAFKNQSTINRTLQNLTIPTLILTGDHDNIVPPKYSKVIKKLVKTAELKVLRGAHHFVTVERPEEVSQAIHNFIKKHLILNNNTFLSKTHALVK